MGLHQMNSISPQDMSILRHYFKTYRPKIILVIIFGSHGTDDQKPESDLDFAILFQENIDLYQEMNLLAKLSDILQFENIDLVNLNKAPVTLQFNALGGKIIYEHDHALTSDYMEKVFTIYGDYAPVISAFDQDFIHKEITLNGL